MCFEWIFEVWDPQGWSRMVLVSCSADFWDKVIQGQEWNWIILVFFKQILRIWDPQEWSRMVPVFIEQTLEDEGVWDP